MSSLQARCNRDKSLDDSLTNIQWLCGLESSELLLSQRASRMKETAEDTQSRVCATSPNPHPKPPYSYATMILLAINSTEDKRMTLQDIYKWIEHNYPYYKKCKKAWKNSIRHNLSLHSFFLKEKRPVDLPGKGSYWSISPEGKKNIMREVMKHAQPVIQTPLIQPGLNGRNLRPILPKPMDNISLDFNEGVSQKMPGVCSVVNGNTVMPVVILPTNVYMDLASKIASTKKASSGLTVRQEDNATIKVLDDGYFLTKEMETRTNTCSKESGNVSALMDEILRDQNFSKVLDNIKIENESDCSQIADSVKISDNGLNVSNQQMCCQAKGLRPKNENLDFKLQPLPKKIKVEPMAREKVYKKSSLPCPVLSTPHQHRSPLKDIMMPTLAAMNSENTESFVFCEKESKPQDEGCSLFSPIQFNTPCTSSKGSKKTSTPSQSSPLSSAFRSGLTPLKYDSDSGFFTPLRDSDFDFLLSPNQLPISLQITPAKMIGSTPQGCRKSLRLGTVPKDVDRNDILSWM